MDSAASRSLQLAKLQALAGASPWSDRQWAPVDFGPGAALRVEGDGAPAALVLPFPPGRRSLGEALVWADRHGIEHLDLLIDASDASDRSGASGVGPDDHDVATVLARRAGWFMSPGIAVYRLVVLAGERPRPERVTVPPLSPPPAADLDHPLVTLMADGGLEIVAEGGIVRGEINGLEVARVVPSELDGVEVPVPGDPGGNVVDGHRLDVGVGQADRELTAYVHAGAEPASEVARVRDQVRELRRADAAPHPLNQLVPERWLRAAVSRSPERLGLATLRPLLRVPARSGMTRTAVAAAEGTTHDGRPVVAVFSVGMDVDLVPAAAEMLALAEAAGSGARAGVGAARSTGPPSPPALWLVTPERDAHPVTRRLAAALREPAEVVPVPDDWRTW